jgi:cytochrome c
MSRLHEVLVGSAALVALSLPVQAERLGLGRPALPEEIAAWDVAVLPDGQGLRHGSGSLEAGEDLFDEQCAACHGDFAEGRDA